MLFFSAEHPFSLHFPLMKKRRGGKLREMSERMSDKIEVRENCVKMQRRGGGKERGKEIILSKPAFISLTVGGGLRFASVRTSRGATFSPSPHFFHPLFSSISPPNAEWPPPTPTLKSPSPLLHQTHFYDCSLLCIHAGCSALKEFLTRPWIRLVAPHSLFLSARLDTSDDIRWTLIHVTFLPGTVTQLLPLTRSRESQELFHILFCMLFIGHDT